MSARKSRVVRPEDAPKLGKWKPSNWMDFARRVCRPYLDAEDPAEAEYLHALIVEHATPEYVAAGFAIALYTVEKQSVDLVTVTNERDALRSALNVAVELLQRYTTDEFGDDVALNDDIDAFLGVDPP